MNDDCNKSSAKETLNTNDEYKVENMLVQHNDGEKNSTTVVISTPPRSSPPAPAQPSPELSTTRIPAAPLSPTTNLNNENNINNQINNQTNNHYKQQVKENTMESSTFTQEQPSQPPLPTLKLSRLKARKSIAYLSPG